MGGPFQPPIRAPGHGRGSRLIALTSFYSPARRKSCGFFCFAARRTDLLPGRKSFDRPSSAVPQCGTEGGRNKRTTQK
jgi:hypothetical protein